MNFYIWKVFTALWKIYFLKASVSLSRAERGIEVFSFPVTQPWALYPAAIQIA